MNTQPVFAGRDVSKRERPICSRRPGSHCQADGSAVESCSEALTGAFSEFRTVPTRLHSAR